MLIFSRYDYTGIGESKANDTDAIRFRFNQWKKDMFTMINDVTSGPLVYVRIGFHQSLISSVRSVVFVEATYSAYIFLFTCSRLEIILKFLFFHFV